MNNSALAIRATTITSQATPSVLGLFVALVALVALVAADGLAAQSRFENATAGISLAPPAGWHVMSMQSVMDNGAKVRLPDDQLTTGLQRATAPLFVFSKYPESHPALNPTVQVVLRPTPASLGPSPTAIMKATISTLQQAFLTSGLSTRFSRRKSLAFRRRI